MSKVTGLQNEARMLEYLQTLKDRDGLPENIAYEDDGKALEMKDGVIRHTNDIDNKPNVASIEAKDDTIHIETNAKEDLHSDVSKAQCISNDDKSMDVMVAGTVSRDTVNMQNTVSECSPKIKQINFEPNGQAIVDSMCGIIERNDKTLDNQDFPVVDVKTSGNKQNQIKMDRYLEVIESNDEGNTRQKEDRSVKNTADITHQPSAKGNLSIDFKKESNIQTRCDEVIETDAIHVTSEKSNSNISQLENTDVVDKTNVDIQNKFISDKTILTASETEIINSDTDVSFIQDMLSSIPCEQEEDEKPLQSYTHFNAKNDLTTEGWTKYWSNISTAAYDSDSSLSDSDSTSSESSIDERIVMEQPKETDPIVFPKTKDEILPIELPQEPILDIALPEDVTLLEIGVVTSIVGPLVIVKSLPTTPAVDMDTLLFLENKKCIGKVFETFGPVKMPFYTVRFDSAKAIESDLIEVDLKVFIVPEDIEMTKLVFTSQIQNNKGSDASWEHDQEPPEEFIVYSDDEEEAAAKKLKKQARKANRHQQNLPQTGRSSLPSGNPPTQNGSNLKKRNTKRKFTPLSYQEGRGFNRAESWHEPPNGGMLVPPQHAVPRIAHSSHPPPMMQPFTQRFQRPFPGSPSLPYNAHNHPARIHLPPPPGRFDVDPQQQPGYHHYSPLRGPAMAHGQHTFTTQPQPPWPPFTVRPPRP